MSCNLVILNELDNRGYLMCPFCSTTWNDTPTKHDYESVKPAYLCCYEQEMCNDEGRNVCANCGTLHYYDDGDEYVDYPENLYKMRRMSVYERKYHIVNTLIDIHIKYKIILSVKQTESIMKVFEEIDKILPQINWGRKRMIGIKYILKQLFEMLGIQHDKIPTSKEKKTLTSHQEYWKKIVSLKGDEINKIINQ